MIMCDDPRVPDRPKWAEFFQLECCSLSNIRPRWGPGGSVPQGRFENFWLRLAFRACSQALPFADDQNAAQVKFPAGCVLEVSLEQTVGPD